MAQHSKIRQSRGIGYPVSTRQYVCHGTATVSLVGHVGCSAVYSSPATCLEELELEKISTTCKFRLQCKPVCLWTPAMCAQNFKRFQETLMMNASNSARSVAVSGPVGVAQTAEQPNT